MEFFKNWAIPGEKVPGGITTGEGETLDALSGHFRIFQYKDGHRFSTDDVLTAWYGTSCAGSAARVLDLGSGIGSVGMIAAWRLPRSSFVTVEAQSISVTLARKSARYNGIESRYEIREGDFRDPAVIGGDERFDLILGSPPYFPLGTGLLSEHEQKIACRFEVRGDVSDYCKAAAPHLSPGGVFACVFPTVQESRVESAAAASGLRILRSRTVVLREGESSLLSLYAMSLAAHLPPGFAEAPRWRDPDLIIRRKDGSVHPEYQVVKLSVGFPP